MHAHSACVDHEQLLVIEDHPGTRVRVLSGGVWLTEQGKLDVATALSHAGPAAPEFH